MERAFEFHFATKTKKVLLNVKFGNFNSRTYLNVNFVETIDAARNKRIRLLNDKPEANVEEQENISKWYGRLNENVFPYVQEISNVDWEWYYEHLSKKYDIYSAMNSASKMLSRYEEEKIVFSPSYLESPYSQVTRVPAHTYRVFSSYTSVLVKRLTKHRHYSTFSAKPKVKSEIKSETKLEPMDTGYSSMAPDSDRLTPAYIGIQQQVESLVHSDIFKTNAVMMLSHLDLEYINEMSKLKKSESASQGKSSSTRLVLKLASNYSDIYKVISQTNNQIKIKAFLGFSANDIDTVEGIFFDLEKSDKEISVDVSEAFWNKAIDEDSNTVSFTLRFYIEQTFKREGKERVVLGYRWEEDVVLFLNESTVEGMENMYKATVFKKNWEGKFGEVWVIG